MSQRHQQLGATHRLRQVAGGAEKLRNVMALSDASTKLLRPVFDDVWVARVFAEWYLGAFLRILCMLGMCVIVTNIMERCSLFVPPRWGAGPMALMLWLDWVIW
jgi:hypothetical protein